MDHILATPVPAIIGHFGEQLQSFTTQLRPSDVVGLLNHDPRSSNWKKLPSDLRQIYEQIQRKTANDRRNGTSDYIWGRFQSAQLPGAFPAICIGLTEPVEFVRFRNEYGHPTAAGTVLVPNSSTKVLLDGLARLSGALDLKDNHTDKHAVDRLFNFPIVIYAPSPGRQLTISQLGQLFYDFNALQTHVPTALALSLDQSDPYVQLANRLGDSRIFRDLGGVERKKATLGKKSTAFTTQQTLVRTIRGAMEGRAFQESDSARVDAPNLSWSNFEQRLSEITTFFELFATHAGQQIRTRDTLLYTSPGVQVLGLLFHDAHFRANLTPIDRAFFIQRAATIDWSRYNPDWLNALGAPELGEDGLPVKNDRGQMRVALGKAGANTIRFLIKYLREKTELARLLSSDQDDVTPIAEEEADDVEYATA